jgi:hypothetical protein
MFIDAARPAAVVNTKTDSARLSASGHRPRRRIANVVATTPVVVK